ncbi:MAG: SHOCT domain-containing protein [Bacteroidia bacterium]
MYYDGYHFWGMHLVWWFFWGCMLFWIFATPYYVPFQQKKNNSPLDVLRHRLASGQITNEEYNEKKKMLEG